MEETLPRALPRDVPTYDYKPEMSAREATDAFVEAWRSDSPSFGIINFANADMVGHTGVIPAAVRGIETVDQCLREHVRGELTTYAASTAKLWTTEMHGRLVDQCLQFFGGYGFMREYEICRLFADARVLRIYGGTSEIMRELISRSL